MGGRACERLWTADKEPSRVCRKPRNEDRTFRRVQEGADQAKDKGEGRERRGGEGEERDVVRGEGGSPGEAVYLCSSRLAVGACAGACRGLSVAARIDSGCAVTWHEFAAAR